MSHNLDKKPSRGILKTSRSVDAHDTAGTSRRAKEQRFDEMNIIETFHPADKDYGHMKIDEPKTPYAEPVDFEASGSDALDASELAAKLTAAATAPPRCTQPDSDDETDDERQHRAEFEKKRKIHYNEFQALQLARKLMEEEEEEEDDDEKSPQNGA